MAYTKVHEDWQDSPSTATPILAADLEHIEQGIFDAAATAETDATTSIKGRIELATDAETIDGLDGTKAVTPASYAASVDPVTAALVGNPASQTGAALSATIAMEATNGTWRFGTSVPAIKGAGETPVLVTTTAGGEARWQVSVTGPGRVGHFVIADTGFTGSVMAFGLDFGNSSYPHGILLANKAQSRGMVVDNQATVTDPFAYGLYVRNASAAAPAAAYEQNVAGAAVALRVLSLQASASQKMVDFRSNTGSGTTEEAGHIRADNGWFIWNKLIKPGTVTTATRPTGLGASTRGSFVYDTDLQAHVVFTDASWRRVLHGPTAPPTVAPPTGGTTVDTEARAAIASIITALQGTKVLA